MILRLPSLTLILVMMYAAIASGHTMWLNVSDYSPPAGGSSIVYFGWGHRYPVHDLLNREKFLKDFYLIDPEGRFKELSPHPSGLLTTRIDFERKGTYLVAAELEPGFYTMWLEDGKINHRIGPKTGLSNVVVSTYYEQFAKAIINVRDEDSNFTTPLGHKIEIVPLKNPVNLREGDYLPVKILYEGKPLGSYPTVFATYLGFSTEDEAYAYTTAANGAGIAQIRILKAGIWMIKVNHKVHPTQKMEDKCNEFSYTATLSFEVN